MKRDNQSKYGKFIEVERYSFKNGSGKELLIVLTSNAARVYKIEFFLENELIKPIRISGINKAYEKWASILKMLG